MVGQRHRCITKSRGGEESRPAEAPGLKVAIEPKGQARSLDRGDAKAKAGVVSPDTRQPAAGVAPGPREPKKAKIGRPRIGTESETITHRKPWVAEGISERTWWRRQAERRAEGKA
jgi:hypothetical protein